MPIFGRKKININFDIIPGPNHEVNIFKRHHLVTFTRVFIYFKENEIYRVSLIAL